MEVEPCYYCGMPASAIDHVVPRKLLFMLNSLGDDVAKAELINSNRIMLVNSCRECNSMLSSRYDETLLSRKRRLRSIMRRRYKHVLETPEWTITELESIGYSLQQYIIQQINLKRLIIERLRWQKSQRIKRTGSGEGLTIESLNAFTAEMSLVNSLPGKSIAQTTTDLRHIACGVCGKEARKMSRNQKYCSGACRQWAYRQKSD